MTEPIPGPLKSGSNINWLADRPGYQMQQAGIARPQTSLNDHVQTIMLGALLYAEREKAKRAQEAERQQALEHWADVAQYEFGLTDPVEIRRGAKALYEWDERESEHQEMRNTSDRMQPWRLPIGTGVARIAMGAVLVPLVGAVLGTLVGIVLSLFLPGDFWNGVGNSIISAGMILGWMIIPLVTLYQMIVLQQPTYDPMASELCRVVPPGSTVWSDGEAFIVQGWPTYEPGTLQARWRVDRPGTRGQTVRDGYGYWLWSSDMER